MLTATSNQAANTAIRYLQNNATQASSSLAKLASGSRIVKASDDTAALAIGTRIKADISALKVAQTNVSNAQSLLQVADGGMARISDILLRMKALATQSQSGSVSNNERSFLDQEYQALRTQIDGIASQTRFNGQALLNGSAGKSISNIGSGLTGAGISVALSGNATAATWTLSYDGTDTFTLTDGTLSYTSQIDPTGLTVYEGTLNFATAGISVNLKNFDVGTAVSSGNTFDVSGSGTLTFQIGANASSDTITVNLADVTTTGLGLSGDDVLTSANASAAASQLDTAIASINGARATAGSLMSRFEFAGANLATQVENLDAARANLMDVDVADEMSRFSSANVLQQAATAMLAQANQMPQNLLRLMQ